MTTKFEAGKTYTTCSICDSEAMVTITVLRRTAQTLTAEYPGGRTKTLRISVYEGVEQVSPWGRYSMSPIIDAEDTLRDGVLPMLEAAVASALGVALN